MNGRAKLPNWTDEYIVRFRRRLLDWFAEHQRDLPWRRTRDPMAIWISEIMLQQTQVSTVVPYFERFLARFPDVESLAAADEQAVLELWSGLGYYRRARQLHAAAKQIVDRHDGIFPTTVEQIQELPGVGRYTAGAIASQAFDVPAAIVEANTQRVYARLLALRGDLRKRAQQQRLWSFAERLHAPPWSNVGGTPAAGAFNQALMELGSLVCTPGTPNCGACPVASSCRACQLGVVDAIPTPTSRPTVTEQIHVGVLMRRGEKWLMRQNTRDQWWSGLWDFPRIDGSSIRRHLARPATASGGFSAVAEHVAAETRRTYELSCQPLQLVGHFAHAVTRYRIRLYCVTARPNRLQVRRLPGNWRWVDPVADPLPLTAAARRVYEQVLEVPLPRGA